MHIVLLKPPIYRRSGGDFARAILGAVGMGVLCIGIPVLAIRFVGNDAAITLIFPFAWLMIGSASGA